MYHCFGGKPRNEQHSLWKTGVDIKTQRQEPSQCPHSIRINLGSELGVAKMHGWYLSSILIPSQITAKTSRDNFGLKKQLTILYLHPFCRCESFGSTRRKLLYRGRLCSKILQPLFDDCKRPAQRLNRWWMSMDFPSIFLWFYHVQWIGLRKISTGEAISICSYEISGVPPVILFPETFIHCDGENPHGFSRSLVDFRLYPAGRRCVGCRMSRRAMAPRWPSSRS